jgi:Dolichyl-phosphate-mannose-protein mannosyltransferase
VLSLIREYRWFFLGTTLSAIILRLFFFIYFPTVTDDSRGYADLATNWLRHDIYGQTQLAEIVPSDTRLPGYPAFLAGIFWLFGSGNLRAVLLAQMLLDLVTCVVVADLARRLVSERAARIAFFLAALCPFLANYAAAMLTETLEVFFTALALDCAATALNRMREGEAGVPKLWAATGAAISACILLRPDGGILLVAVVFYLTVAAPKEASGFEAGEVSLNRYPDPKPESRRLSRDAKWNSFRSAMAAGIIVALVALAPLAPWTVRNFRTLHHFQPLAPRYANETDELVLRGFNRWVRTWMADYVSVEEIYWNVPGDKIDPEKLPSRALDSAAQRDATLAILADYNQSRMLTPELDARFGRIAADRIRAHPVRYYVVLPLLRIADMWLRPRTEILPPDPRWWEFNDEPKQSVMAVGFGLLNLAYVAAALGALVRRPRGIRWAGLLVSFVLLRSAFLGSLENPESRYTLECYPVVMLLASAFLARRYGQGKLAA